MINVTCEKYMSDICLNVVCAVTILHVSVSTCLIVWCVAREYGMNGVQCV